MQKVEKDYSGKAFSGDAYSQACDIEHLYIFVELFNEFMLWFSHLSSLACKYFYVWLIIRTSSWNQHLSAAIN